MSIHSIALVASEAPEAEQAVDINPYVYGATALIVLLALLIVVTRFNINR
ncbi:MAG: hypothetical protein ACH36H_10590 [Candidatus Nanopelagicales bacterium]